MQGDELERTLEAAGVVLWMHDLRTDTITVSRSASQLFTTKGVAVPRSMDELRGTGDPQGLLALDWAPPGPGEPNRFVEEVAVQMGRRTHWMRVVGSYLFDDDGTPSAIRGTFVDVTAERLQLERHLIDEELLRQTVEISGDAFVAIDADGLVTHWNPAAERLFGWPAVEAVGCTLDRLTLSPETADRQMDALAVMLAEDSPEDDMAGSSTTEARCKDGSMVPVDVSWVVVGTDDGPALRMFARDVSDRVAYEHKLTEMALKDELTGLPNRALLLDRLDGALGRLRRAEDELLAVLFIDLDRFKVFNDSLGHAAGDELLIQVARRLEEVVRPSDAVARFGGDELVVLCERLAHVGEAVQVARRIIEALAQPFEVAGREHFVTVSIGIAPIEQPDGIRPEDVIRDADAAMYRAKASGGGSFELFDQRMREEAVERLTLENELNQALRRGELAVHHQPMLDLDGGPAGCEALVRWMHPERGTVLPAEFIPIAEETGLIGQLGAFVLDVACRDLRAWMDRHLLPDGFTISVNVSSRQLQQPGFVAGVAETLRRHRVPAERLCIELTESVLMHEGPAVSEAVDGLHRLGVMLAVDDFGTGYSSLVYLRRFPLDVLKIDRLFVAGLEGNDADRSIVVSLVGLARSLGMVAVAEGVETEGQLALLRELGCPRAQGHLWSAALPAEQAEAWLFGTSSVAPAPTCDHEDVLVAPLEA
jgi:diguanylate cyclase (GGDEF)-like protein/PAS domain S-box-containing protein